MSQANAVKQFQTAYNKTCQCRCGQRKAPKYSFSDIQEEVDDQSTSEEEFPANPPISDGPEVGYFEYDDYGNYDYKHLSN